MFSAGNFRNFPIDYDVSVDSINDQFSATLSHSITSFDTMMPDWQKHESHPPLFSQSFDSLDTITADKTVESLVLSNSRYISHNLNASMSVPDLCDVIFLVGPSLVPIYGQRAIMAKRSVILHALFITHESILGVASRKSEKRGFLSKLFRKKQKGRKHYNRIVISLPEHEETTFGNFIAYLHSGTINTNLSNLTGLLRLADIYCVDHLRDACMEFADRCVTSQTVVRLLESAQHYTHCQSISQLVDKLMVFIDRNCRRVIQNKDFLSATPSVATLILTRPQLPVSENDRISAILTWCKHHHRHTPADLPVTLTRLIRNVDFSRVSNCRLRSEVIEHGFVPQMEKTCGSVITSRCRRRLFAVDRRVRLACSTLNKAKRNVDSSSSGFDSGSSSP